MGLARKDGTGTTALLYAILQCNAVVWGPAPRMALGVCATVVGVTLRRTVASVKLAGLGAIAMFSAMSTHAMAMALVIRTGSVCVIVPSLAILTVANALQAITVQTALSFATQILHATVVAHVARMVCANVMRGSLGLGVGVVE